MVLWICLEISGHNLCMVVGVCLAGGICCAGWEVAVVLEEFAVPH